MSDSETIQLACLGRPFQLGMLYDCRRDHLIPGITLWDAKMLHNNIDVQPQPNTDFKIIASDSSEDKVNALNVSAALEASFMSGLFSVKGSGDYLNNKKSSKHQSRVTLQYQTTSCFEQLTMEHLGAGNVKYSNVLQEGSATHVVTALLYGAQAFFIFDCEVSSDENHQKIQGDLYASIKKIPLISIEGQASLEMKEMDQEKTDKFSCTFHGDFALESNPVSYNDAIKVYSELPKLFGKKGENAVPMTAWLYPLKKLDSAAAQLVREISVSLIRRVQRIMDELHNCDIHCQDLMRDNIAIQFPEITAKISKCKYLSSDYKTVFQGHLCRVLPLIRGGGKEEQELIKTLEDQERSPFKGALVTKYLNEREREINVVRSYLDIMKDIPVLSSSIELDKVVLKASNDYVVAFALTSLNENEPYLSDLENYLKKQSSKNGEQVSYDQNSSKTTQKWFSSGDVTALTRETIQAFLDFKEANKGRTNTEFCIASIPDELSTASSIHVYERGRLISSQYDLPSKPPMPVFLSAEHDCVLLQIKPPDRGVSSVNSYCISYRSAQSSEWTEVFTDGVSDQVTIKQLKPHAEYCFTCKAVCRPGVSLTSDPTSFFRTRPCAPPGAPTIKQVESETATVVWDVPISVGEDVLITGYVLEFRECTKDQENEKPWKSVQCTSRQSTLEGLKEDTDYTVRVFAICGNDGMSLPSPETVVSACLKSKQSVAVRSELFLNQSLRLYKGNPSIYTLKLYQKSKENKNFNQYVFGKKVEDVKSKVILLLGATGAGKTTLINVMANYILGVKWQDAYRFKLINEVTNRTEAESQTSIISSYELNSQPGFQIPYSLTIIDTPGFGDTRGLAHDKLVAEQIKSFLCSPLGIDHIDAVCLVAQASLVRLSANQRYVFDSILSIFGKDVAENIIILATFSDSKEAKVLEAIKAADLPCKKNENGQPTHFKFNNSAVYAEKKTEKPTTSGYDSDDEKMAEDKLTELVWCKTFREMKAFFSELGAAKSKDLTQTRNVLEERERLQKAMESLTPQITAGLSKMNQIKKFKQLLENENDSMNQNENFEQEVEVMKPVRVRVSCSSINCNSCFFTCHYNCFLPAQDPMQSCAVMKAGRCIMCPGNCYYSAHSRENFKWTYETRKEKKTIGELKDNFMKAKGMFMENKQIVNGLEAELGEIETCLKKLIRLSSNSLRRLNEIALKPTSLSTDEYFEILIKTEQEEKKPGFEERIAGLQKMKKGNLVMKKIEQGEDLLAEAE